METSASTDLRYTDAPCAVLVAPPDHDGVGLEALAVAGIRVLGAAGLDTAVERLVRGVGADLIHIDTTAIDVEPALALLSRIDNVARERGIGVVIALRSDQIDPVSATVFGSHVRLLCDPDIAERALTLSSAAPARNGRLNDVRRDADERLRMLNAEVARFAETLQRLAQGRKETASTTVSERRLGFTGESDPATPARTDAGEVRDVIRARRIRANHFAEGLFADPAWDMLLDLFAAELEHRRVSVSSLCIAAAVPGTTALRWIGTMIEGGLFERYADPVDRRRAFVSLSPTARSAIERYFDAVRRAGLAPA